MEKEHEIKTVVPALRFPEFRKLKEWEVSSIGDSCQILNNKRKPISEAQRTKGPYPYYGASGIIDHINNYIFDEELLLIGEDGAKWGAYENSAFVATGKYWVNNHAHVLKPIQINIIVLRNYLIQLDLAKYITGAAPPKLTLGKLKEIEIPISKVPLEQQKIADCLSSLDDLIEATNHKIEALKEHKKGLMQRLFPKEGENVPELRFPEFQGTKGWNETVLGNVIDYENGKAHENDIDEDGKFIVVNSKFISTEGEIIKKTNSPYCLANKSDILMVLSDVPNGHAIAKCFFVDQSDKYTVNQRICRLRSKNVNSKLLFYLINRNPYFLSFDDGVKQTNLKKADVLECSLMIPTSPLEQQNIANTLSSIDKLIITTKEKIKTLKEHKKGLMQQLFPKI